MPMLRSTVSLFAICSLGGAFFVAEVRGQPSSAGAAWRDGAWSPITVCFQALLPPPEASFRRLPQWDERSTYASWAKEAKRRGYTPEYCLAVIAGASASPPPPSPIALPAPDALVASIQTLLEALGYDVGGADGMLGPRTRAAIVAFQERAGDVPDGKPTEALRGRLQSSLTNRSAGPLPPGPRPPTTQPDTKPVGAGTGFYISTDVIVTNHHVVEGCKELRIRKRGTEVSSARLVAVNRGDDLAALRSADSSQHFLRLRVGVPIRPAESVIVFGYPLSFALSSLGNTTLGNVTALTGLRDDSRFIQISASIQPGNSGGPVLDEAGRLTAVIASKLDALKMVRATGDIPQNVNFAIRVSTLVSFLEANQVPFEVATTATTLSNVEIAERAEKASVQIECRK